MVLQQNVVVVYLVHKSTIFSFKNHTMITTLNSIGLEVSFSNDLAHKLNLLLADYQIFYQNARGFHWNIKGDDFFELHLKFEELYNDLKIKIDEM